MRLPHAVRPGFLSIASSVFVLSCSTVTGSDTGQTPGPVADTPIFGPTAVQFISPPPISGGTLLVSRDGLVVAADADRDAVFVVDLEQRHVDTIALAAGDEPGRAVEDSNGRVH